MSRGISIMEEIMDVFKFFFHCNCHGLLLYREKENGGGQAPAGIL